MSDHIEESLKSAAVPIAASTAVRQRLGGRRRTRMVRTGAIAGLAACGAATAFFMAAPRTASASDVYSQVSKSFQSAPAIRVLTYSRLDSEAKEELRYEHFIYPNGYLSRFFPGSVMEFTMREEPSGVVMWFPRLGLAQSVPSTTDWLTEPPRASEDFLSYVQRRFMSPVSEEGAPPTKLPPLRSSAGLTHDGRRAVRLDFQDLSDPQVKRTLALYADDKSKTPIELAITTEFLGPHKKTVHVRCDFDLVSDPQSILKQVPPAGISVADMKAAQANVLAAPDISPLFGGVKRAFRGPNGGVLIVSGQVPHEKVFQLDGHKWSTGLTAPTMIGEESKPHLFAWLAVPATGLEAIPFAAEPSIDGWAAEAAGFVSGRTLAWEYTSVAMAKSQHLIDNRRHKDALEVVERALKNQDQLGFGYAAQFEQMAKDCRKALRR